VIGLSRSYSEDFTLPFSRFSTPCLAKDLMYPINAAFVEKWLVSHTLCYSTGFSPSLLWQTNQAICPSHHRFAPFGVPWLLGLVLIRFGGAAHLIVDS
jgi:hypothetical protein